MKTIRQLKAEAINDTETNSNLLEGLVRTGLYEENKLTLLRRALDENNTKLSNVERKTLQELAEKLIRVVSEPEEQLTEATGKVSDFSKMPPILILKRRSIRVFGGGQQVAMYWSDVLNRYIAIPFDQQPIMTEAVTWAQQRGYEKALVAAHLETNPVRKAQLQAIVDQQKAQIVRQYGQSAFGSMHTATVDALRKPKASTAKAKKTVEKAQEVITAEKAGNVKNFIQSYATSKSIPVALGATLGAAIRKPFVASKVKKMETKVNRLKKIIASRNAMSTIRENFQSKLNSLREDTYTPFEMALDAASFYGPASIPAAVVSGLVNVVQGDWDQIPMDILGAVPEVGPLAKVARRVQKGIEIGSDIAKGAKKAEKITGAKPRNQDTVAARKNREALDRKMDALDTSTGSIVPPSVAQGLMGQNQNQKQNLSPFSGEAKPTTGFDNQITGIEPFANRASGQNALNARIAAAKRSALSEEDLNEVSWVRRFRVGIRRTGRDIAAGLLGYSAAGGGQGGGGAGGGGDTPAWLYNKQKPQTGFARGLNPEDSFSKAIRAGYYDNPYATGQVQMGKLNRGFMMKEGTVLSDLHQMIQEDVNTKNINIGNDSVLVTQAMASNIVKLFETINDSNKVKLDKMLNESTGNFYKVLDFAVRH